MISRKISAGLFGVCIGLLVIGTGTAQISGEEQGEFLLLDDGPEGVVAGEGELLLDDGSGSGLDADIAGDSDTLMLDDVGADPLEPMGDDAIGMESDALVLDGDEGGDTLMLDGGDEAGDTLMLDDAADEPVMVLDEAPADDLSDDVMVLDDGGLELDAEPIGAAPGDEADVFVLEDEAGAPAGDVVMDDIDADMADMAGASDEPLGDIGLETGADEAGVMVLGEDTIETSPADDALLQDLDAEMAGFGGGTEAEPGIDEGGDLMLDGDAIEPGEDLAITASPEMDDLDADMAGMLGAADAGKEAGAEAGGIDDGAGALVLDDVGELDVGAETGMEPGAEPGGELVLEEGAALALDDDEDAFEDEDSSFSVYAVLKNETAVFVKSGTVTGREKSTLGGGDHDAGKVFKSEFSLNVFANAQITENALVHAQLNLAYDPFAEPDWYRGPKFYTQYDPLKELYLDTTLPLFDDQGVFMRLGKQQVVWGTADGIKLLDIINPTDYREFVQNTFEDSRIPVVMLNLERDVGDNGNIQFIAAENRRNRIPGLDADGDSGQPFIMKGVDSITGTVNGFLNIAPALGKVADAFNRLSALSGSPIGLTPLSFVTVDDFATNNPTAQAIFGSACSPTFNPATPTSAPCLKQITERPDRTIAPGAVLPGGDNQFITNLIDADTQSDWDTNNPNSAFEYMNNATFATFNTFVSAKSRYERDEPDALDPNLGGRWKSTLGNNLNYSLNYFYAYDVNPSVSISWQNDRGEELNVKKVKAQDYVDAGILPGVPAGTAGLETVLVKDSAGNTYGAFDGDPTSRGFGGPGAGAPTLVFTETRHRVHNLGASFDYALDTNAFGSFVLRGEFLYQNGVRVPMINRTELGIGNITEGLKPDKVNFFKYVLGAETIVFTNLTISAQFIQFINLDHKDDSDIYHGNPAVLHLTNGLKKGYKYYNFGSLFLSKPFGPQQDGRVNNIFIAERGGGYWNRLDVEYRFTDQFIGTAELNMYFGDRDTMFGQFRDSSNFQIGMKYIFD